MEGYQEFLNKLQKRGSKPYKIAHCLGARDAWKWVRRNKWKALDGAPCSKLTYGDIISTVNSKLAELMLEGHEVELPYKMGSFILCSLPSRVFFEEGEYKTNYRTDWLKTLALWYEDEKARNTHKPIKRIAKSIYFIRYYKSRANYKNKRFYKFRANRSLVRKLGAAIERGRVNTEQRIYD